MKLRLSLWALLFVFLLSGVSFAAINVDNPTGTIKIMMPDGKQLIVKQGEQMPTIPDGSVITIMDGSAVVSTTGKSTASVLIGAYTLQIREVSKVNLRLNADGTVDSTIILGEAVVTRKPEAFRFPRTPNAEQLQGGGGEILSPSA